MDIHLFLRGDAPTMSSYSAPSMPCLSASILFPVQGSIQDSNQLLQSPTSSSKAQLPDKWELQARHDAQGGGSLEGVPELGIVSKWRQKERLKTTAVALVLCLNIGVDPPDVIKISPCARLECWVDPLSMQPPKALETIGM